MGALFCFPAWHIAQWSTISQTILIPYIAHFVSRELLILINGKMSEVHRRTNVEECKYCTMRN